MSIKGCQAAIFNEYEKLHRGSLSMLKRQYKSMPPSPSGRRPLLDALLELVHRELAENFKRKVERLKR